jgi:hypothetical protein
MPKFGIYLTIKVLAIIQEYTKLAVDQVTDGVFVDEAKDESIDCNIT